MMKSQPTDWEKLFATDITKWLIFKTNKNFILHNVKKN